jgi:hypothetical protein
MKAPLVGLILQQEHGNFTAAYTRSTQNAKTWDAPGGLDDVSEDQVADVLVAC